MTKWLKTLIVLSLLFATPQSLAQEICASTPASLAAARLAVAQISAMSQPRSLVQRTQGVWPLDEALRNLPAFPPQQQTTPWGTPASPYMYSQVIPTPKQEKETRFSWWGFGHDELHAKDPNDKESYSVIDELEKRFGVGACCSGMRSGECRITKFEEDRNPFSLNTKLRVIIDGEACDVTHGTKFAGLNSFKKPGYIVACAAKTYRSANYKGNATCSTYCIGTPSGY
jgi:hypothetical protein